MACDTPFYYRPKGHLKEIPFPCGKCPNCKHRRVNEWVFRLLEEQKVSLSSYFVTLTYDTNYVPISKNGFMTLKRRDFQLFMKRLRKYQEPKIRYYMCGEYGDEKMRPHYHLIIFNIEDIEFIGKAWKFGEVHIGKVSSDSIAYTCKYIDKEKKVPVHKRDDRIPEFSAMSKGLGENYLTDAIKKYHKEDLSRNYVRKGNYKVALPRYYRKKILDEDEMRLQREIMDDANELRMNNKGLKVKRLYGDDMDLDTYLDIEREQRFEKFKRYQLRKTRKDA